ncbi:MAG: hypothetical protein NC115_10735 [Bacteroidales bacterium]|nr:hypothetical protein [Bacteroidales bacterium]
MKRECYIKWILPILLTLFTSNVMARPFILKKDIKEHLWNYLYENKIVKDAFPPHGEPLFYYTGDGGYVDNRYILITNLTTGQYVDDNSGLDDIGIYSFIPLYFIPEYTYVFIKYHDICTIVPSEGDFEKCSQFIPMMNQVLDFLDEHTDLPETTKISYIKSICNIYVENMRYTE